MSCRKDFFIPVRVMSTLFRGKFLDHLKNCFRNGDLIFPGAIRHLEGPATSSYSENNSMKRNGLFTANRPLTVPKVFSSILADIPTESPSAITASLISRTAKSFSGGVIMPSDKKNHDAQDNEFIRRFLLHVLPDRYVRIRHFGLLANRNRKDNITLCRELLGGVKNVTKEKKPESWQEQLLRICGIDVTLCPVCKKGKMLRVAVLSPSRCNDPPEQSR